MPNDAERITERKYLLLAAKIIGDFGVTLAVPVVALAWLGRRLDLRYGTSPWLLVAGFVLAFGISLAFICRKALAYGREYEAIGHQAARPKNN